ncbi:M61 family metallopeptidase [soil metagenome]
MSLARPRPSRANRFQIALGGLARSSTLALLLTTAAIAPAMAQSLPVTASDPTAGSGLAVSPVPAVQDKAWPGVVRLSVDATDLNRRIFRVHEVIPVEGTGPLTLFFPQWLPGDHSPDGPITQLAGLVLTAEGQRLEWTRDPVQPLAFHLVVPDGATAVVADFQALSPTVADQGRIVMTAHMLNVQWEKMLLYPAGRYHRNITTQASVVLPAGWSFATALETGSPEADGSVLFKPVPLDVLVDSPLFAGEHYRQVDLDPGGRSPVRLDLFGDTQAQIAVADEQIADVRSLVQQADRLFGARHFDHYDFLVAPSDQLGDIGLEHHRSTEIRVEPGLFTEWESHLVDRDVLAHEYVHSWNGKWRRPAGQNVPNYNTPLQNELLWVYEGQTQFWGKVLTARSGLVTRDQALDDLATVAAQFDARVGRDWRPLQDTVYDPIISNRAPKGWISEQRDEDYYREGLLVWLDVDSLIREKTGGRKSLDDFARAFFGTRDGEYGENPYSFDDVVSALNGVVANDWAAFLRARLDGHGLPAGSRGAPLDGLTRGGYRLVYTNTKSPWQATYDGGLHRNDFTYSLGFLSNDANMIDTVQWDGPAYKAGLAVGMQIVSVNGEAASPSGIADAITASKNADTPIQLIVKDVDRYRTVSFDYHEGLRYPHLERITGTPDRLGDLLAARRR